jgi:hypothetical protein
MKKLRFKGSQLRCASRRLPKHSDDVYGIFPVVIRLTLTYCKVSASLRSPLVSITPQVLNGSTTLRTTLRKTNDLTPADVLGSDPALPRHSGSREWICIFIKYLLFYLYVHVTIRRGVLLKRSDHLELIIPRILM